MYDDKSGYDFGQFETKIEAAKAFNEAAIKIHGSKAKLNKIPLS